MQILNLDRKLNSLTLFIYKKRKRETLSILEIIPQQFREEIYPSNILN